MIEAMNSAFGNDADVKIVEHDFDQKLPRLGPFDERQRALSGDFRDHRIGGAFCNLEHVASPTRRIHEKFLEAIGWPDEDPLREIGFVGVDCHWKWRELALFAGWKPV